MKLSRTTLTLSCLAGLNLFAGAAAAQISFEAPSTYNLFAQRPDWVAVGDFDGVNGPDLAVTSGSPQGTAGPDWVELFTNNGNGTFTPGQQVFMGNNTAPAAAVADDFDGDGDVDLAVSLKNTGSVQLLVNTGGVLAPGPVVAVGGLEPRHMVGADLDGDGDTDLVTSNRDSNNLSVLINTGAGFSLSGTVAVGLEPRYLVLANLVGDANVDVAVASHDSRRVDVLTGLGGGAFGAMASYPVPGNEKPSGMVASDLDGDGDLDLATTTDNNGIGMICVLTNTGGVFSTVCFLNGGQNPSAVVAADFDVDGDMDLAAADEDANFISAHANNGGFFGPGTNVATGAHPSHLATADLDGNGSADLATVNRDSNTLTVVLNSASGGGIGRSYCGPAVPNSSGASAVIAATGSTSAAANNLTLTATNLPANRFGYFLAAESQGFFANPGGSQGNLCLGSPLGRFAAQMQNSGPQGVISIVADISNVPLLGPVMAGDTFNFQCWFRDVNPGSTSNFTDAVSIQFN